MKIQPLANRIRPTEIDEVIGQKHLLEKGKPLYRMIKNNTITSMILFGPPGIGKTTIATAISGSLKIPFRALNGVSDGKKEIEAVIKEAKSEGETFCLYIDEIHRLTRTQSEPLLPVLENGTIILIGSTTESVYHSLPSGILSRCTVYELKPLGEDDILEGLKRAVIDKEKGMGRFNIDISDDMLMQIANVTGGDMRSALNALETLIITNAEEDKKEKIEITTTMIEEITSKKTLGYNGKDSYYDYLSFLQKAIRGSDTDAALYALALLLESGDLVSACRRLSIIAFEDISLADHTVWPSVMAAMECAEKVGLPEARIPLANAVVLMCLSSKSNSAYKALDEAIADVKSGHVYAVPSKLKDSHYSGAAKRGHGVGYLYPHNYNIGTFGSWVAQDYLPVELKNREYYRGSEAGSEKRLTEIHKKLKNMQKDKEQ